MKATRAEHRPYKFLLWLAAAGAMLLQGPARAAAAVEANPNRQALAVTDTGSCSVHGAKSATFHADTPRGRAHLRVETNPNCRRVILERVWGTAPDGLSHAWDRVLHPHDGQISLYPLRRWSRRDRPFTVGFRIRAIHEDGTLGPPSPPIFVTHTAAAEVDGSTRSDQVMFAFFLFGMLGLWRLYRREPSRDFKVRLAAASALASLMFLSVTPAMPWIATDADLATDRPSVECQLGEESACSTFVPDGGPDPLTAGPASVQRNLELSRWICASAAVRIGLVLSLILLLPGLIWLLVVPKLRAAQAAVAVGASVAAFTFLSVLFYRLSIPSWMAGERFWTFDIALLSAGNIVASSFLIAKCVLIDGLSGDNLPRMRARRSQH